MASQSKNAPAARLFSPLLEAAIRLAAQGHYHQFRKRYPSDECSEGSATDPLPPDWIPYITHLMGSMAILARLGAPDEVLAAALLHDYLEDVPDPDGHQTIRSAVGDRVLELVLAVTEQKPADSIDTETWEQRKREQIERMGDMPDEAVLIKTADLLHNVQSLISDLAAADQQQTVWRRLNAGPDRQLWYFSSVLEAARTRLGDHQLVHELARTITELRARVPA
jgi:(p)ppGpp synthase/HD superfamily hydrolase